MLITPLFAGFVSLAQVASNLICQRTSVNSRSAAAENMVHAPYIYQDFLSARIAVGIKIYAMRYNSYQEILS
jgi:hypothetical protein